MNDNAIFDPSNTIEKYLEGMRGFLPFIERVSKGPTSQLVAFLKMIVVIFSLVAFTLFIIISCILSYFTGFKSADFAPNFFSVIIFLVVFILSTVFICYRLKLKEGSC